MTLNTLEMRVLDILSDNARLDAASISVRLGAPIEEIRAAMAILEDTHAIIGYTALIDWDRVGREKVQALIEVRVTPQRERGFDAIAAQMIRFDEVRSLYLMSGGFDLMLIVEAATLKELAMFVSERLSVMDNVLSTATHFVLKKYKSEGVIIVQGEGDERLVVSP